MLEASVAQTIAAGPSGGHSEKGCEKAGCVALPARARGAELTLVRAGGGQLPIRLSINCRSQRLAPVRNRTLTDSNLVASMLEGLLPNLRIIL